jgi:phosphoribosylformylglycinamidine cyclo-ligase
VQDCIICGTIDPAIVKELVDGLAEACRAQGCVLTGGETSVQPGVVADGVYVLSANAIGVVERDRIIDGSGTETGDVVLAVASNGLHTNGYTLVRKLLEDNPALKETDIDGESFLDVVMRPHKCYYQAIRKLFQQNGLKSFAHITGGGIGDNLNRVLPTSLDASVDLSLLRVPAVFGVIRAAGKVSDTDMVRTFNTGVGLAVVCSPEAAPAIIEHMQRNDCACYPIGEIVPGSGNVQLSGAVVW